jgi:hypothetical protein
MIPHLITLGAPTPWPVLPPGIHDASMVEIQARFATTPHRSKLFGGFERAATALRVAGCQTIYLNGSFVTDSPIPGDFDGCWEIAEVDPTLLDPVLLNFENMRMAQKQKYHGEMFIASLPGMGSLSFLQLFQREKYSGRPKGILRISF